MNYKFKDLVDIRNIEELISLFYQVTGIVITIKDSKGIVLATSDWRTICTNFHRINAESSKICLESDNHCSKILLEEGDKYKICQCGNGLIDATAAIHIQGEHVATLFAGQVLLEEPIINDFIKQAQKYNYEESEYLKALSEVPIMDKQKLEHVMNFLCSFAEIIGNMGLKELKQIETQKEIQAAKEQLVGSQKILIAAFEELRDQYNKKQGDGAPDSENFYRN